MLAQIRGNLLSKHWLLLYQTNSDIAHAAQPRAHDTRPVIVI